MKRRYIYILLLIMAVCLNACGKPEKITDKSNDNKKKTVLQTENLGETEMPDAMKNPVEEDDTENDLPMIEFEKTTEKPEADATASAWSQDAAVKPTESIEKPTEPTKKPTEPIEKPTEPTKKPTEPTENPTENPAETPTTPPVEAPTQQPAENPTEPTPEPAEKPIELPFAPIN